MSKLKSTKKNTTKKTSNKNLHKNKTYVGLLTITFNDLLAPSSKNSLVDYGYFKNMVNVPSLKFYFEVLNEFAFGLLLFVGLFLGTMFTSASLGQLDGKDNMAFKETYANEDKQIALENVEQRVLGANTSSSCSFDVKGDLYSNKSTYALDDKDVYVCVKGLSNKEARWFLVDNTTGESLEVKEATELKSGAPCAVVKDAKAGQVLNLNAYELGKKEVTSCQLNFAK